MKCNLEKKFMKIIKNRNIILIIFIFYSISSLIFLIKEKKIFAYKNKSVEYTLEQVFKEGYKLNFYDIEFERVDKVGENDSYFAIFFLSARNERVSTLSIKNYYIIDKNKNEIYKTSEKDIIEKGIILEDVDIFVKKKGIMRNIYIYFNLNIFLFIGSFFDFVYFNLHMSQYIEIFYAILIITYNILLLLSKKYFNLRIKYKLRKYFVLTNLIILFFYIFKEPLFFYSSKKIILVLSFLLIEIFFTFFVHKIRIKIKNWKEIIEEIFRIVLISAFVYFFQYLVAMLGYLIGIILGLGFF